MIIGDVKLDNNIVLAPMAGITDKTYRSICKEMGVGLVVTEMVSAKGLYYKDKKTEQLMDINQEERPVALQIFGSDPEIISSVIKSDINKREDIDILDINMGCPAPKIVKNEEGSALLKDPEQVKRIVYAAVNQSNKPVSVKIRIGWDESSINGREIARIIESEGASALTVHGRTREMYYSGEANWDYISQIKSDIKIPLIGNGDIFTPDDAIRMLEETNCDGIAIARGALGNPFLIDRILRRKKGMSDYVPTYEERISMIIRHLNMICEDKGERIGVREMRKHISWYLKAMPDAKNIRNIINGLDKKADVIKVLLDYKMKIS